MKYTLLFCTTLLAATLHAAEAPKPRNGEKVLVINDDGFSPFFTGQYKTAEDLRKQMLSFRDTQVAVFEWCITAGSRSNFPSKVTELIGDGVKEYGRRGDQLAAETLHRLAKEGVDTLQVVADGCHEAGMLCYASMRMNGDYAEKDMEGSLSRQLDSNFWRQHPEFRVRGMKGEDKTKLSFAYPEVRAFKLGILKEAAMRNIDGISLDFLRHPPFFGFEEPLKVAFQSKYQVDPSTVAADDPRWHPLRAEFMTIFLREVRKILDEEGQRKHRHLGLSARIDWREHTMQGCDIGTWLKEGMLDYVVIGQHTLGGYEFDLAPFVAMAKGTGCAVLFGEEAALSGHDLTPKEDRLIAEGKVPKLVNTSMDLPMYQARAARWYAAGADGIQLFNERSHKVMSVLGSVKPASK